MVWNRHDFGTRALGVLRRYVFSPAIFSIFLAILRQLGVVRVQREEPIQEFAKFRNGRWELFNRAIRDSKKYAEWGVGESTQFVALNALTSARSIETDPKWANKISDLVGDQVDVVLVDLGTTKEYGFPVAQPPIDALREYFGAPFHNGYSPDTVLIDGRYRVACFLTSLLELEPGAKVIFDDYPARPEYHIVEEVCPPEAINQQQALFIVPRDVNRKLVLSLLRQFERVMD